MKKSFLAVLSISILSISASVFAQDGSVEINARRRELATLENSKNDIVIRMSARSVSKFEDVIVNGKKVKQEKKYYEVLVTGDVGDTCISTVLKEGLERTAKSYPCYKLNANLQITPEKSENFIVSGKIYTGIFFNRVYAYFEAFHPGYESNKDAEPLAYIEEYHGKGDYVYQENPTDGGK